MTPVARGKRDIYRQIHDSLTVGSLISQTVGDLRRRLNSYRGLAVRGLRDGDTGDKWNRWLVGLSDDLGSKQAE